MIDRLIAIYKSSRPVLVAASWLSILMIAMMFTGLPSMTEPVYGFGGEEEASWSQNDGSVWNPLDSILGLIRGRGSQMVDTRRADREGKLVALQAGHWKYWESPPPFNTHTGGSGGGTTEPEVALEIARRAAKMLEEMGYTVEILPAWFPQGYTADAVVSIHSDGAANTDARGFFAERYENSSIPETDDRFMATLNEEYANAADVPFKYRSTVNSRFYYGFTRIKPATPMVLIETGFLSNEQDRQIIVKDPDQAARGIANGVDKFLLQ